MTGTSYFDPNRGYVTPSDDYETDTGASLKEIIKALGRGDTSNDLYDVVERLLYKYQIFIQTGVREDIAAHKGVTWYLVDKCDGRALISYQDGARGEWFYECFADEVPLWLLSALLRRIARRKPLDEQADNETIETIDAIDNEYVSERCIRESAGGIDVIAFSTYLRRSSDDHDV